MTNMNQRVLLLNASWEAIRIISMHRAIILIVEEKAEIVERRDTEIRSPSLTLPCPSVVRLKRYVKVPIKKRHMPLSRRAILNRDGRICAYCNKEADTIDHIQPRSRGGKHEWLNVVAACRPCNSKKGNKLLKEIGWKLGIQPVNPEGKRWLIAGITDKVWEEYIPLDLENVS